MKTRHLYQIIETIILFCSLLIFWKGYKRFFNDIFSNSIVVLVGLVTAALVNVIKLLRIYIIIYGQKIKSIDIGLLYAKTAIVNSVIPYKFGEIYRMFCLDKQLKDVQKGIIITILDRFMDTIGILIVLLGSIFLTGAKGAFYPMAIFLIVFLVLVLALYYFFPGLCSFWKNYLLKNRASKHKLWGLEILTKLQYIYKDIETIVNGRGLMLISCSVIAWLIEIGSIYIINKTILFTDGAICIPDYLNSILTGNVIIDSARYTVLSIVLLLLFYFVLLICKKTRNVRREK